jgi:hypothetical protein
MMDWTLIFSIANFILLIFIAIRILLKLYNLQEQLNEVLSKQ